MKILVTGAQGFIGKNLITELSADKEHVIYSYDMDSSRENLTEYCADCGFLYHFAGVNRPKNAEDYMKINYGLTKDIIDTLLKVNNTCPILFSSSSQAALNNPYGKSKKACEGLLHQYSLESGAKVYLYRFPNVFGKWSRPNYNSVVATFCYNISHNLPIQVNDPAVILTLVYIDDLVKELHLALYDKVKQNAEGDYNIQTVYTVTLGTIAALLYSFKNTSGNSKNHTRDLSRNYNVKESFIRKLYATYLSYLDYPLNQ